MKSLVEYIEGMTDRSKVAGSLLCSLFLGIIDYRTGDYSFSLFYVLPIACAAWFVGKRAALWIALFCGIELYSVDLLVAPGKLPLTSLRSWNAFMEVGLLLLTAYLISTIRNEMEKTRHRSIELEMLNHDLSAFNYSVAHDLRSPLIWIGGYCRSILKHHSEKLDEGAREHLRDVCDGTQKMEQLIDTLLEFSQLAHGDINPEPVDLSNIAQIVAEELVKAEPGRQANFLIAGNVITAGDQRLLRVVMENLLSNAWKYTSEQEEAVIEFGVMKRKGGRAYFVRDNGAGFNMASAGKLFAPFQRLHDSDRFKGHGIGLAMVKRIVNRHNGEIWAQSRVGTGTTFYFTLCPERSIW